MKKILFSTVLCLLSVVSWAADGNGSLAMPFVNVPHNPVTAGEGGVYLARSSSLAYGALENIASLPLSASQVDVSAAYQVWSPGRVNERFINFGTGLRFGRLALSVAGSMGSNEPYTEYREGGFEGTKYTPKDMTIGGGLAYGFGESFAVGVNAKYLSNSLTAKSSYTAFCVDVMGFGRFGGLSAGAGVRNLGSRIESHSGDGYSLPMSLAAGAAYDAGFGLGAEVDAEFVMGGGLALSAGAHYCWNDMVTLRAGYHKGVVLPSFLSIGGGFKVFGVCLDASYVVSSENAAGSLCLGLGYRF